MSKRFRIIPRVAHYGPAPDDEAILFLPDLPANRGHIAFYAVDGEHGEADIAFYREHTSAPDNRAIDLCVWYIRMKVAGQYKVTVQKRLNVLRGGV